jgi:hypothetical protein
MGLSGGLQRAIGWRDLALRSERKGTSLWVRFLYQCAMVPEGTLGKWSLWATHPKRLGAVAELYATEGEVDARATDLKHAGYTVAVTLSKLNIQD